METIKRIFRESLVENFPLGDKTIIFSHLNVDYTADEMIVQINRETEVSLLYMNGCLKQVNNNLEKTIKNEGNT